MSEETFKVGIMASGTANQKNFKLAMEACQRALELNKTMIQIEWVDCSRISELEAENASLRKELETAYAEIEERDFSDAE